MRMQELLQELSADFFLENNPSEIERMVEYGLIDQVAINNRWLGYPPASEHVIALKEHRLGVTLPPSYRSFLLASNGFRFISIFQNNLLPIEKIDWAVETENKAWLEYKQDIDVTDEEYFCYDDQQDTARYRHEYLKRSLKISNWYDGMCVFLNPVVKYNDEWEVLEYATWHPGAKRYRSFEEFLHETHKINLKVFEDNQHN